MTALDETTTATPNSTADVMRAVEALCPAIAERAAEIEAGRRIPPDLLDDLVRAGVFRLLLPPSHGGLGGDLDVVEVLETLAAADGSTGWTAMIGAGGWIDLAGLPRTTFDALFDGSDVITAGVFNPTGSCEAVEGGYRVTGRWAFASGCQHATLLYGNCIEGFADGVPQLRTVVLLPEEVVIEDTWHVSGLCGTGSHHFRVEGVVVPAERTFATMEATPCVDAPLLRLPPVPLLAGAVATIAVGIARGALHDIRALAAGKVPMFDHMPLAANPAFQTALATADAELRAARQLLRSGVASLMSMVADGREPSLADRAEVRAGAVWATAAAARVVETAYRWGGGSALYSDSSLQRRLRDVNAVTQHFLVRPDTMTTAGAILAGNDVEVMVF